MKWAWLLLFPLADLIQPVASTSLLGRTLWVLEGHVSRGHYWATPGTLHAALAWALSGRPAEGGPQATAWSMFHEDAARLDAAFRARFGVALVKRQRKGFTEYDSDGIRAAFRAIYVPPSEQVGGRLARDLYRPLRGFVAEAAQTTACMLSDRKKLDRVAKRYAARGRYSDFDWATFDCVDAFSHVTAGVILRRRLDGTLPVLVEALRTVLSDYDPETFAELDSTLRL